MGLDLALCGVEVRARQDRDGCLGQGPPLRNITAHEPRKIGPRQFPASPSPCLHVGGHRHDIRALAALDQPHNLGAPELQGGGLFLSDVVLLVDPDNSAPGAAGVAQARLGDRQRHAQFLQAGGDRSADIVNRPAGDAGRLV